MYYKKDMSLSTQGQIILALNGIWTGIKANLNSSPDGMCQDGILARNQESLSACCAAIHD